MPRSSLGYCGVYYMSTLGVLFAGTVLVFMLGGATLGVGLVEKWVSGVF